MKKAISLLPMLALSLFFAFCDKSANVQEVTTSTNPEKAVSSRGTCQLDISASNNNTLQVCGLSTNPDPCVGCPTSSTITYQGVELVNTFGSFTIISPIEFAITNTGTTETDVQLTTGVSSTPVITIKPGECEVFLLDDNCFF